MPPRTSKESGLKLVGTASGKSAGKGRSAKPATAKVAAAEAANPPKPVKTGKSGSAMLKLRDLVDGVAAATGMNKKDTRLSIEATLDVLAAALMRGDELNLPPLGRARVAKSAEKAGTTILTLKLRLRAAEKPGAKQALAVDGEDS